MRKKISLLILLSLIFLLIGCSSNSSKKDDENYTADKDFIIDLGKGLEKRWSIDDAEFEMGSDEHKNHFTEVVKSEYNYISDYKDLKFDDSTLGNKAIEYIGLLEAQLEALDYMPVDYEKYSLMWSYAYDQRTKAIADFTENYGLAVSKEHSETLDEIKLNAKLIIEKEALEKDIQDMINSVEFTKIKEDYGWADYEAIVENTCECVFEHFDFQISLLDKDGVIIESTYTSSANNWKPGQKAKFEFSTDKDFETMEFTGEYYINEN